MFVVAQKRGKVMRKFLQVEKEFMEYEKERAVLPKRATVHSAGYDFVSPIEIEIKPHESQLIWTNVKAKFEEDEVLMLAVTSGMGKRGIMLANNVGIIDCDYYGNQFNDGNIGFRLYNFLDEPYVIKQGDKIGQGIFLKFLKVDDEEVVTQKRKGGFGSTDKK